MRCTALASLGLCWPTLREAVYHWPVRLFHTAPVVLQQRTSRKGRMAPEQPARACCTLAGDVPEPPGRIYCRFDSGHEVPATVIGRTVCCTPPADVFSDEKCQKAVFTVVADDGRSICGSCEMWPELEEIREGGCKEGKDTAAQSAAAGSGDGSGGDFGRRTDESHAEYIKREYSALRPFVIISSSYLLYTTTDGAIRMIVLMHAYNLGFSAWLTSIMFMLYELAGVVTNLAAGLMGARWGIKTTLLTGLCLQVVGISMLFGWQDSWAAPQQQAKGVVFITCAQMLCGVAKDLTKLGGKTVTKLVTPEEKQSRLFKVVSFITGFKNSMKGVGYFIGAAAISFNYYFALGLLLALIFAAMPWAALGLSNQLGRARKENVTLRAILHQRYNVNVLSVARFFLFGSRDLWFEVPLPFFMRDVVYGLGWSRLAVGAALAAFIIGYGQVQSWTPQMVLQPLRQSPANKYVELLWNGVLILCPTVLAAIVLGSDIFTAHALPGMIATLVVGLAAYCFVFAVNSSVHSYLIVRYSEGDKVAMNVGFYYMANAMGRLVGTLASGAIYTFAGPSVVYGLGYCFIASMCFAALATVVTVLIRDDSGGLRCGTCLTLVKPPAVPLPVSS